MKDNGDPAHAAIHDTFRPTGAPPLYSQDGKGYGATVHAHYFVGSADWLVTEYDPEEDLAFGWACLGDRQMAELGYVSMAELEAIQVPIRVRVMPDNDIRLAGFQTVERERDWPEGLSIRDAITLLDERHGRE